MGLFRSQLHSIDQNTTSGTAVYAFLFYRTLPSPDGSFVGEMPHSGGVVQPAFTSIYHLFWASFQAVSRGECSTRQVDC